MLAAQLRRMTAPPSGLSAICSTAVSPISLVAHRPALEGEVVLLHQPREDRATPPARPTVATSSRIVGASGSPRPPPDPTHRGQLSALYDHRAGVLTAPPTQWAVRWAQPAAASQPPKSPCRRTRAHSEIEMLATITNRPGLLRADVVVARRRQPPRRVVGDAQNFRRPARRRARRRGGVREAIKAHGQLGDAEGALDVLRDLQRLRPELLATTAAIRACATRSHWPVALSLLGELQADGGARRRGVQRRADGRAERGGQYHEAELLLREMREHGPPPDAVTFNTCITAAARASRWERTLRLLSLMEADPSVRRTPSRTRRRSRRAPERPGRRSTCCSGWRRPASRRPPSSTTRRSARARRRRTGRCALALRRTAGRRRRRRGRRRRRRRRRGAGPTWCRTTRRWRRASAAASGTRPSCCCARCAGRGPPPDAVSYHRDRRVPPAAARRRRPPRRARGGGRAPRDDGGGAPPVALRVHRRALGVQPRAEVARRPRGLRAARGGGAGREASAPTRSPPTAPSPRAPAAAAGKTRSRSSAGWNAPSSA